MKATKKLILAAVSLVAASSLTVGSTFAWFSYQSSVELDAVQFSVDSGDENLQVAVVAHDATDPVTPDESAFSYSLSAELIKSKINNGTEIKYRPLTVSEDGADNSVSATNPIALVNEDGTNAPAGSYAVFDLVFRYTPVKTDEETVTMPSLVLNSGSDISAGGIPTDEETGVAIASLTSAWANFDETDYGIELNAGDPINARARDAARVAFLYDDKGTTQNKVWAPSEVFDNEIKTYTSDRARGFYLHNLASDYKVQRKDSVTNSASPTTYSSRIYKCLENPTSVNDFLYSKIAEFPKLSGTSTSSQLRVTVKVWLEGKDGDCLESFQNDTFAFTLKFRTSTIKNAS